MIGFIWCSQRAQRRSQIVSFFVQKSHQSILAFSLSLLLTDIHSQSHSVSLSHSHSIGRSLGHFYSNFISFELLRNDVCPLSGSEGEKEMHLPPHATIKNGSDLVTTRYESIIGSFTWNRPHKCINGVSHFLFDRFQQLCSFHIPIGKTWEGFLLFLHCKLGKKKQSFSFATMRRKMWFH